MPEQYEAVVQVKGYVSSTYGTPTETEKAAGYFPGIGLWFALPGDVSQIDCGDELVIDLPVRLVPRRADA